MGWLDDLFNNLPSDPRTQAGVELPWLRPIVDAPSNAPPVDGSLGTASQGPSLLDRLTAGATNLTTGGDGTIRRHAVRSVSDATRGHTPPQ